MAESQISSSCIEIGPGGRIMNPGLLENLEHAPVLQPRELIRLSTYFNAFSTNAYLGNLLWVHALELIVTNRVIEPVINETYTINMSSSVDDHADWDGDDERKENPNEDLNEQSWIFHPIDPACFFGLGLLIEKRLLENGEAAFYVVNACPNPQTLPDSASAPSH